MSHVVPIPARLEHRPTLGGVVLPWANVHLADGGVDFRAHHRARHEACWTRGLCQARGETLTHPVVLLGGPNQLRRLLFDEPALHPECAAYTSRACPMVAGQRTHYADRALVTHGPRGAACYIPGCDCSGWVETPGGSSAGGSPAHEWYAVYVRTFVVAVRPDGGLIGGACQPSDVLTVRLVSEPGKGRCWRRVDDPLADYEAPQAVGVVS